MNTTFETTQKDLDKEIDFQKGRESMKAEIIDAINQISLQVQCWDCGNEALDKLRKKILK